MRFTAGMFAGLTLLFVAVSCGDDDTSGSSNDGGANEGGSGGSSSGKGGTSAGTMNNVSGDSMGGTGGVPAPTGCTDDMDCEDNQQCIDDVCKGEEGAACNQAADCIDNCIDDVCTSKLPDDAACVADEDCAHTCIDEVCRPKSSVGGDCDVDLGEGGGGGMGGTGGGANVAGMGGEGGAAILLPHPDCQEPYQCYAGKCLGPDGAACTDNVDCINTCINSVCEPQSSLDGACDEDSDCVSQDFVCDPATDTCKLAVKVQCTANEQCQSERCICADATCLTRACKTANSTCLCRWSPKDSETCNVSSAPLSAKAEDPNGCNGANFCSGNGQCVPNAGGDCVQQCQRVGPGPDGMNNTADDVCGEFGAPSGCNPGYSGEQTPNGACKPTKVVTTVDGTSVINWPCQAQCTCELD